MWLLALACLNEIPVLTDSAVGLIDSDGDGFAAAEDCDDSDPAIHPDADELCNGLDDNCDDVIDDDAVDRQTWYADVDGDDHGDPDASVTACEPPTGHVAASDDCDDEEPRVHAGAAEDCDYLDNDCDGQVDEEGLTWWYLDADGDGFGDVEDVGEETCGVPEGKVGDNTDCDDARAETFPGADEYCNGEDDDCDGAVDEDDALDATEWFIDADHDGFGSTAYSSVTQCEQPEGYVDDATDCDDLDEEVFPGADERCNGVDDDCDGDTDEDSAIDAPTWYEDGDGDGFGDSASTDVQCEQPGGFVEDDTDCDDADAEVNPAADELCSTSVDDDCDGSVNEDDSADATDWYADTDGDGYGDAASVDRACDAPSGHVADDTDCDDSDGDANPGADEYCDGHDDDCDGDVDEDDAVDASTWYADDDEDSYGDDSDSTSACSQPSGYEATGGDCDDGDDDIHPGADEYCNGDDDDCDGDVDEDDAQDASTFYADSDGDGYGDASSTNQQCYADSSYIADDTDCDDTDGSVNPGATEVCGNGVDDDCDGGMGDDCGPYGTIGLADAHARVEGDDAYDYVGYSVAAGDLDGDGYSELVTTGLHYNSKYYDATTSIFQGPVSGSHDVGDADTTIEAASGLGSDSLIVPDLDGDGLDDLVISSPRYPTTYTTGSQRGGIFFFYGPGTGELDENDADAYALGDTTYDNFGYRIAQAGDADGDGNTDLWTSSISYLNDYGSAILLEGPLTGKTTGANIYIYDSASDYWGSSYAGIDLDGSGDTNGDGSNDVLVGASGNDEAWVLHGPVTITTERGDVDAVLTGASSGSAGLSSRFVSDWNGDGYDEVAVGAPYESSNQGRVYIVNGPVSADVDLTAAADATLNGPSSAYAGYTVEACDVDGDGNGDVVVGAPGVGTWKGKIYLFLGPLTGSITMVSKADGIYNGENTAHYASYYEGLHCGGDTNADGYDEILIGAVGENSGGAYAGVTYLLLGGGGL